MQEAQSDVIYQHQMVLLLADHGRMLFSAIDNEIMGPNPSGIYVYLNQRTCDGLIPT